MIWCRAFWRDHSLTIVSWAITLSFYGFGRLYAKDRWDHQDYDFVMNLGHATFSIAILYTLSWFAREKTKPED
jgi:hypothetical protein